MAGLYDVIVIGLGGMGSSAAYHLARRGQKVLGLERFGMAHDKGSSHGGSRIVRQAYFEDSAYVPLLLRAYELWEEIGRDSGEEILTVTGGLMMGSEGSRTVAGSIESARLWDLDHEVLGAREIRVRFPTLAPGDDTMALFEARAGLVRPELSVAAHAKSARKHGAELRFEEPVLSWEADPSGEDVRVETGLGTYEAGRLVVCPGPWAPKLVPGLDLGLWAQRLVQYWFRPEGGAGPFAPGRHPIWIWEAEDGVQFYGFPSHDDGGEGSVKTAFFRVGERCDPDEIDRTVHEDEVEHMRDRLRSSLPALGNGEFLRAATCMYTNTPDENFVISHHPEHPQVTVAMGFSGHGFKFVPVVGEILADLTLEGKTAHPIDLFDPKRLIA